MDKNHPFYDYFMKEQKAQERMAAVLQKVPMDIWRMLFNLLILDKTDKYYKEMRERDYNRQEHLAFKQRKKKCGDRRPSYYTKPHPESARHLHLRKWAQVCKLTARTVKRFRTEQFPELVRIEKNLTIKLRIFDKKSGRIAAHHKKQNQTQMRDVQLYADMLWSKTMHNVMFRNNINYITGADGTLDPKSEGNRIDVHYQKVWQPCSKPSINIRRIIYAKNQHSKQLGLINIMNEKMKEYQSVWGRPTPRLNFQFALENPNDHGNAKYTFYWTFA